MTEITILHRYDADRHYEPIYYGSQHGRFTVDDIHHYSFISNPRTIPRDIRCLWNLLWNDTDRTVILGAEPFDPRVPVFARIAERHNVIYHTSWPYWSGSDVPRTPFTSRQRTAWDSFLEKVHSVTVSKAAKQELSRRGYEATHIPHGVRTDIFKPSHESGEASNSEINILFVGRLVEEKGIQDLLAVANSFDRDDVNFQFVGSGPLVDDVKEAQTTSNVEYLGYISDREALTKVYAAADIFVLPSFRFNGWEELFGIVLIEAMAAGLPVVTTDNVGPREIIEEGETGHIVSQRSIPQLITAIEQLINHPRKRNEFGKTARREAVEKYDMEKISQQWDGVFQQVSR